MFTVDLRHRTSTDGAHYVLRLRDRVSNESRSLRLRPGIETEIPIGSLPGPANQIVAWIDEIDASGARESISSRVRLDSLKHVARLEQWLRNPGAPTTAAEASAMYEKVVVWEYFGDSDWAPRLTRVVNDVLRLLQRMPRLARDSRVLMLCDVSSKRESLGNSLAGNVMISLAALGEIYDVFDRNKMGTMVDVVHASAAGLDSRRSALNRDLRVLLDKSSPFNSKTTASFMFRGQVLSTLEGRAAAGSEFRQGIRDGRSIVKALYTDMGALTYGEPVASPDQIGADDLTWYGVTPLGQTGPTILYSANIAFLRRYLARVFFYAMAEPSLHLHLHIVDAEAESRTFIDEAEVLIRSMHGFAARSSALPVITWSSSPLPSSAEVGDRIAYYACSRYLIAERVMDKWDADVWIHDVDLYPLSPISAAHEKLSGFDVVLAANSGMSMIAPWRRYLAGNVFLSSSQNGRRFTREVARYISSFISASDSWMLDQNALDWGVETAVPGTRIGNMSALPIHLTQSAMNGLIES